MSLPFLLSCFSLKSQDGNSPKRQKTPHSVSYLEQFEQSRGKSCNQSTGRQSCMVPIRNGEYLLSMALTEAVSSSLLVTKYHSSKILCKFATPFQWSLAAFYSSQTLQPYNVTSHDRSRPPKRLRTKQWIFKFVSLGFNTTRKPSTTMRKVVDTQITHVYIFRKCGSFTIGSLNCGETCFEKPSMIQFAILIACFYAV